MNEEDIKESLEKYVDELADKVAETIYKHKDKNLVTTYVLILNVEDDEGYCYKKYLNAPVKNKAIFNMIPLMEEFLDEIKSELKSKGEEE